MSFNKIVTSVRVVGVLIGLGLMLGANPAEAQLSVCNKSQEVVSMVVAYWTPQGQWVSKGWFVAKPGECPTLVGGPLTSRYYWVRGEGVARTIWSGDYSACIARAKFNYVGEGACEGGFEPAAFFRIDTGDLSQWTHSLTQAPPAADGVRERIASLRIGWRRSGLDGTLVMQVHNPSAWAVNLRLKCFTLAGLSKFLQISVAGNGMSEVGYMQGWPGNFVPGERCEAYRDNEQVWYVNVPRQ